MKPLIAIASCKRDCENGFNQAIRDTWGKEASMLASTLFFTGKDAGPQDKDVIELNCPDDYLGLPWKTYRILEWALANGYSHIFKCDTDTYVRPRRMLKSNYHRHDYVGNFVGRKDNGRFLARRGNTVGPTIVGVPRVVYECLYSWASGGAGYWLSAKAAKYIMENPPDERAICPHLKYPCEDLWIGNLMGPQIKAGALTGVDDTRYGQSYRQDYRVIFTAHFCSEGKKRSFNTEWMHKHHQVNRQ